MPWDALFDGGFVLGWPLLLGLHAWALRSSGAFFVPGLEVLLLLWVAGRLRGETNAVGRAALGAAALALGGSLLRTLPELWSSPAALRFETSLLLGVTFAGFPLGSVVMGLLALGPTHLAAARVSTHASRSRSTSTVAYDLYFGATALLSTVVIVEYAGGPLLP